MTVVRLYPTGDVIANQESDCGLHYQCVDEDPPDDGATKCWSPLTDSGYPIYSTDLYNFQNLPPNVDTINFVRVYMRIQCPSADGGMGQTAIRTYNNYYWGGTHVATSWTTYYTEYLTNPYTGNPWTISEINDLVAGTRLITVEFFGFPLNANNTISWIDVDYTEAAPPSVKIQYSDGLVCVSVK